MSQERLRLTGYHDHVDQALIVKTIDLARDADLTDVVISKGGRELRLPAQWLKHLMWIGES